MEIPAEAYEFPEDYLWIGTNMFKATDALDRERLHELWNGGRPNNPTEELLVASRVWLGFFLGHVIGDYPTLIAETGPLPKWNLWFVDAEVGPDLSDEQMAQLVIVRADEPMAE